MVKNLKLRTIDEVEDVSGSWEIRVNANLD